MEIKINDVVFYVSGGFVYDTPGDVVELDDRFVGVDWRDGDKEIVPMKNLISLNQLSEGCRI